MKEPLYVLDCYAVIYRFYFAFMSRPFRNPKGDNVSAAFGFFRSLFQLFDERKPGRFVCAFDSRVPTFRHELYPEYKATRQKTPEDLHAQVPLVEEILAAMKIPSVRIPRYEADDIIATLASQCAAEGRECFIVSPDKDLLQAVRGPVKLLKPDKDTAFRLLGEADVLSEWGVDADRITDYLSLTGDASDNIPGVAGIGDKTAVKLISEYGSLDAIYGRLSEVKPDGLRAKLEKGKESAYFSRDLVVLMDAVPGLDAPIDSYSVADAPLDAAFPIFVREGMQTLAQRVMRGKNPTEGIDTASVVPKPLDKPVPKRGTGTADKGFDLFDIPAKVPFGDEAEDSGVGEQKDHDVIQAAVHPGAGADLPVPDRLPEELAGQGTYETVLTFERLEAWIARARNAGFVSFDCETDSLEARHANIVGFSLSVAPKEACYVPLVAPDAECIPKAKALAILKLLLEDHDVRVIGQNLKFDRTVLLGAGIRMANPAFDTMIAAWLLEPDRGSFDLGSLGLRYLGLKGIAFEDIVPKGSVFSDVPLGKAAPYAAEDADYALRLRLLFEPELAARNLLDVFLNLEMKVLPILGDMEAAGIALDAKPLAVFSRELEGKLASIEREIYSLVGHEFNIGSPKQLQEVLFVERKLKTGKKTKTGFSTDVSVLEELALEDPVPALILKNRTLAKLKSTYVDSLPLMIDSDGRVHTHFVQTGTATGRLSSRDPNIQNIPVRDEEGRRIRQAFIASPGRVLVSADYSQIELVVLAHLADDPGLKAAFLSGTDIHKRTASLIFRVPEDQVTQDLRRIAKTINFGVIYGMSAFRLSNELRIPRGEAQKFIDAYFGTYSGVSAFIERTVAQAAKSGRVATMSGRQRTISGINSANKTEKAAAERVAVNTSIQGSAADIVKRAMIAVSRALADSGTGARILLQVHDELIIECDGSAAAKVADIVRERMEGVCPLSVPLRVSVETAASWGDMH